MLLIRYIIFSYLIFSSLYHTPKDKSIFIPPVKIPVLLSSNFGELRIDHFHSGIDIKTQGVTGKEVVSCAAGFIYRISVSPTGFGKALYVKHPSGYSTVYAHLDRFTPEIESYVKGLQYERKSFGVTLFPPKERFPVKQGDLIAWTGNSGSSGGPHLHFEVREAASELPVNPLMFDFGTTDNIKPVIEKLAVYPIGQNSFINNRQSKIILSVKGNNGRYYLPEEKEIIISGNAGFGIKTHDLLNGGTNHLTAYSISVEIDSVNIFRYVMDGFPFNESRFVNSHMDYETWMKDNLRIQKTFVMSNDKLSAYKSVLNKGVFSFRDDSAHLVNIIIADAEGNKSILSFTVRARSEKPDFFAENREDEGQLMPYNKTNRFTSGDLNLTIPSGSLYDTLLFKYKRSPGSPVMLSDLHSVHNRYTPVLRAYSLSIKPTIIPAGKESKLIMVQLNENMSKSPVNSTFAEGFVKAEVLSFGDFYIGIDTISPAISAHGLSAGIDLTGKKEFRIKIKDDFSGIKSYEPSIDGKWALMEYDPKNELLIYRFDEKYIAKGSKHSFSLLVTDNRDNESSYSCDFTW